MSRLKELRLHGFKTFADPTRFLFEAGVNAVIGPNGSGKSNMADAVRWVLGEQSNRSLRTRRAADVIFAGSQHRKPQGMAEVVLTLDNADGWLPIDFAEVTIGRRAYRSGESEYLINGARARLRDVVSLLGEGQLGANELVVVGQGTVDAALSLRPEERRQLFEEAAGVKGFQVRKNESLGRLAKARDNLTRVTDLVAELKPQVRRLALQAQHQQQHDTLGRGARALVVEIHRRREQAERSALGEARRRTAAAESALEAHRTQETAGRDAIVAAESHYWEAEERTRDVGDRREATREAAIRAEARLEGLRARAAELSEALEGEERELAEVEDALGAVAGAASDAALEPALARAATTEQRWQAATTALAGADAELLAAEEALAEIRRRESARIASEAWREEERVVAAARRERLGTERDAARDVEAAARREVGPARSALAAAEQAAIAARDRQAALALTLEAAQQRTDEARRAATVAAERVGALRAELDALRERAEHGGRLGSLLVSAGWRSLLDAVDAPEEAWPAIEAIVGGELQGALIWRDGELLERMTDARGAARLVLADAPPDGDRDAALAAVSGRRTLADWIGPDAPAIFHRAVVAPDIEALLSGWRKLPAGWSAVTPQGDLADARGLVVLRGRAEPVGGAAARQHLRRRELAESLAGLEADDATAGAAAAQALAALSETTRTRDAAYEDANHRERSLRQARAEAEAAEAALARAGRRLMDFDAELGAMASPDSPDVADAAAVPDELARCRQRAEEARLAREAVASERDTAREAWQAARGEAQAAESRSVGERTQRAALQARRAQLGAMLPGRREALAALGTERQAAEETAMAARGADDVAGRERAAAEEERRRRRSELLELERGSGGAAQRLAELERAGQAAAMEVQRREDALLAVARERDLALESLPEVTDEATATSAGIDLSRLDDDALAAEQRRVRRLLAQIGSVNPFAVEEHREVAGRLEDLTGQDADLRSAIGSIDELLARLDTEIAERFNAAFAAIGEHFDAYCQLLFAGGSASLQLSDGDDGEAPGGIEIVVRPPGKRLQRLAMLSGGERALTGVALLFAMLTVTPVPFCILDEVDAALDEANIGRFAEALRRLAETIDFVVITHNRATIEVADTIYGVTMTDDAVSRVLSLRLSDLPVEVSA